MAGRTIRCGNCGAAAQLPEDYSGELFRCVYCGKSQQFSLGKEPERAPSPATPAAKQAATLSPGCAIALGSVLVLVIVGGLAVGLTLRDEARHEAPDVQIGKLDLGELVAPESVEAPMEAPEQQVPATATFELHSQTKLTNDARLLFGFVANTSPYAIDKPKVIMVLKDAQGNEVGTDFGYPEADVLAPGQIVPARLMINDVPDYESFTFELAPRKATYFPKNAKGLRVEMQPFRKAQFLGWKGNGKVFNEGETPAKFVKILAQVFNAEGRLIGVETTFADTERLEPGGSARVEFVSMTLAGTPDRFEVSVEARVAD